MAGSLRRCPECGTRVPSEYAGACPGCGASREDASAKRPSSSVARSPGRRGSVAPRTAEPVRVSRMILIRDLLIFELKLFLDGVGDLVFSQIAIVALLWDFIRGGPEMGKTFYAVLRAGEKWDLWLNLYRPAKDAQTKGEGLLQAGMTDANSLLGKIEDLVREKGVFDPIDPRKPGGGSSG